VPGQSEFINLRSCVAVATELLRTKGDLWNLVNPTAVDLEELLPEYSL
jgi:hypothetical protein